MVMTRHPTGRRRRSRGGDRREHAEGDVEPRGLVVRPVVHAAPSFRAPSTSGNDCHGYAKWPHSFDIAVRRAAPDHRACGDGSAAYELNIESCVAVDHHLDSPLAIQQRAGRVHDRVAPFPGRREGFTPLNVHEKLKTRLTSLTTNV